MAVRKLRKDVSSLLQSSSAISSYNRAVEELVYNSLDSRATSIAVRINLKEHNIQVIDNGTAISEDNIKFVGLRHMTNKYFSSKNGQNSNECHGHKGIAISSIVDISLEVTITSRCEKSEVTYEKRFYKGKVKEESNRIRNMRPSKGTTVNVKGFMYNLTVRRNSINILTEMDEIKKYLENIALIHPATSFSLRDDTNNNLLVACPKCKDIKQRIPYIFGDSTYEVFEELKVEKNCVIIEGLICHKLNKSGFVNMHHVYLNKRLLINSKIHNIINSLVKIKDKGVMEQKIKDIKYQKITNWVNQEKVHLPYIINITCPHNSYDLSYASKKTLVEFHNWDLVTNCLKKFINFHLELSEKTLEKNTEIVTNMDQKQSVNLPQEIQNNCKNVLNINIDDADTNNSHIDETISSLVYRVLKKNNKKVFGVSQLKNGVKGKAVKRKIITKKSEQNKIKLGISKNKTQDRSEICVNNPAETSNRSQNRTRKIDKQSEILLCSKTRRIVKKRDEIFVKPSNECQDRIKKKTIYKNGNHALFKQNNKNNVAIKQIGLNCKTFETYSAKKRCNDISKRLKHIMLKRRSEYLNIGIENVRTSRQRHVTIKEQKNIRMYEKNNSKLCVQNTSGQMVIHDFIPFDKYINYGRKLKNKHQVCLKSYIELKPKTNYELLKPMVQENVFVVPIERNCFNEVICLQEKVFDDQDHWYRKNQKKIYIFNNNKYKYAEKEKISNDPENIISSHIFDETPNKKKVSNNIQLNNFTEASSHIYDNFSKSKVFKISNITIHSSENNKQPGRISESLEPITWCSHGKYNMHNEIYKNFNINIKNNMRFFTQEISPIVKPSENIQNISSFEQNKNLNNNVAKKWADLEVFERVNNVNKMNKLKKKHSVTKTIKKKYDKLNHVDYNYEGGNKNVKFNIPNKRSEILNKSQYSNVVNQNKSQELTVSNQNIFTITSSKNATIQNVENSDFSADASQTLQNVNCEIEKENSNNFNDVEVLFVSSCAEVTVNNIKNEPSIDESNPLEMSCINKSIVPYELCEVILESSDLFEESAHNLCTNLTEKPYSGKKNMSDFTIRNTFSKIFINSENNEFEKEINKRAICIKTLNTKNNINNIQNNEIQYVSDSIENHKEIPDQEINNNTEVIEVDENVITNQMDNISNNRELKATNKFYVVRRPNYFPKGMSPIMNKSVKSVTLRNMYDNINVTQLQEQYFNESTYEAFVQDIEKHSCAFESEAQKLDDMTSDGVQSARLRARSHVSSMVFHAHSIHTLKLLKQVDAKFICVVIEGESCDRRASCLALFDQHAVHERVRLEALCADYKDGNNWKSSKCDPFTLHMSALQISQIFHYRDKYFNIGLHFVYNEDTCDSVLVVAVPVCVYIKEQKDPGTLHDTVKALVLQQLELLKVTKGSGMSNPKTIMDLVNMEACRYAIKFGTQLSVGTCARLMRDLSVCAAPFQCAHGRPSMAPIVQIKPPLYEYKVDKSKIKMFSRRNNFI